MKRLPCTLLLLLFAPGLFSQTIRVRIMPPNRAQFLQFQKFDVRVEATASDPNASVNDLKVLLDGRDITSTGTITSPSPNVRNWMFRNMQLGIFNDRILSATASGNAGTTAISGTAESKITVRRWNGASPVKSAAFDATWPAPAATVDVERLQALSKGTRDYVKTYVYGAPRNDTSIQNFTDYVDANGDGYPDNPDAPHKLIINFGANSDRYEDWQSNPRAESSRSGHERNGCGESG